MYRRQREFDARELLNHEQPLQRHIVLLACQQ